MRITAFLGALLPSLIAVLIRIDRCRLCEFVLDQAVLQLFARDPRGFQCSWVLDQRRRACHDLPRTPRRQHHVRKLALRSFCLHSHFSLSPPNDARSFSTRALRRALVQRKAVMIACASRPARSTSSFITQKS